MRIEPDPIDFGDKEVSHRLKDGKLYIVKKVMNTKGEWVEHEFEFNGNECQEMVDANIQVGKSTLRDKIIDLMIVLLEKCKSKSKYVTTDADEVPMPFGNIFDGFDTLQTKLPLTERIQLKLGRIAHLRWSVKSNIFKKIIGHMAYNVNNIVIRFTKILPDDKPKVYDYDMYDKYYQDLVKYNDAHGIETNPEEYDTIKHFFDESKIDDKPGINVPITDDEGNIVGWKHFGESESKYPWP